VSSPPGTVGGVQGGRRIRTIVGVLLALLALAVALYALDQAGGGVRVADVLAATGIAVLLAAAVAT
jgi:hypothetical protein